MGVRLSYTANSKYQMSPRAWYLHYQLKLREERVGSALAFGNAMDLGLNTLLSEKAKEKPLCTPEESFLSAFEFFEYNGEKIDLKTSEKVKWSKADLDDTIIDNPEDEALLDKAYKAEWVSMRRKGLLMIQAYRDQVIPHIKEVYAIQDFVKIENGQGDEIIGYIDFIAKFELNPTVIGANTDLTKYNGKIIIFDNKTSSMSYKEDSVRNSDQLGTYFEYPHKTVEAELAGYIVIPKKIRKQKLPLIPIQIIIDKVDDSAISSIFEQYQNTLSGIKMGDFPCNRQNCEKNPFGCAYFNYCDSHGRDLTGLVKVKDRDD